MLLRVLSESLLLPCPTTSDTEMALADLNMPQLDLYDTSTAISLLRQYFEYEHWYDLSKLQLRIIQNCQVLCAMNPTCGSFIINPRLQRHFMVFAIGFPGQEALLTIFSTFLNGVEMLGLSY
jgi:dynein heavy chain